MKKTVVFIYREMSLGGPDLNFLRMMQWLHAHHHRIIWIYTENNNVDPSIAEQLELLPIEKIERRRFVPKKNFPDFCDPRLKTLHFSKDEDVIILSLYTHDFYTGEYLRHLYRHDAHRMDHFLYVEHFLQFLNNPPATINGIWHKQTFDDKDRAARLHRKMDRNNQILYMVPKAHKLCASFAHFSEKEQVEVFPLVLFIPEFSVEKLRKRLANNERNITAIGRTDFPFKGYLLSVIDVFKALKPRYPNLTLTIIADLYYGNGNRVLMEKLDSLPPEIREGIHMAGKVPYQTLPEYLNKAYICLGSGTTLIDASLQGTIAINATVYTEKPICYGFWYEDCSDAERYVGEKSTANLIEEALGWSVENYIEKAKIQHTSVAERFDIDSIMNRLLKHQNKSQTPIVGRFKISLTRQILRWYYRAIQNQPPKNYFPEIKPEWK